MIDPIGTYGATYAGYGVTGANSTAAISAYDQLLALQAEEQLLSVGTTTSTSTDTTANSLVFSDLLDLSPAALNILNGIGDVSADATVNSTLTFGSLTPFQQTQASAIVAEFAGAPATGETFTQIENALTAAGINPQELSIQQLIAAFVNGTTSSFALNGQILDDTLADSLTTA